MPKKIQDSDNAPKPTVIHLIYSLAIGGMEQVLLDTVNGLADEFNHVVITLTSASESHLQKLPVGSIHISMGKAPGNDWSLWYKLFRLFREHKASVLHTYNIGTLEYQLVGVAARVPIRIHAEHGRDSNDPHGENIKYRMLRRVADLAVHHWVVVSADLESWLSKIVGINSNKISLIENGIDTQKYCLLDAHEKLRDTLWPLAFQSGQIKSDFIIGSVGRLDPVKNQMMLIDLLVFLNTNRRYSAGKYRLVIVGAGEQFQVLKSRVSQEKLEDQVWLTGARDDVDCLLAGFDVFALTSIAEGTPITLLEAMAFSLPIVATSVGGIPALLSDGAGMLIDSGDVEGFSAAIEALRKDPHAARQMGEKGFSIVDSHYGIEKMLSSYKEHYSPRARHL